MPARPTRASASRRHAASSRTRPSSRAARATCRRRSGAWRCSRPGRNDSYRSHSDIIVHVDSAAQRAVAIGGNVRHSVAVTEYDLAPGDFLAPTQHTFALLVNRADEVDPG